MVKSGEIKLESSFDSLKKYGFPGDFKFVLIERIMLRDFKLSNTENFILTLHGTGTDSSAFRKTEHFSSIPQALSLKRFRL